MAQPGHFALLSALVLCSCALPADLLGKWLGNPRLIRIGRDATIASFACLSIAGFALFILLLCSDSDVQNIATRSLRASYYGYEILKPWPGNVFSLLVWLWFQTGIVLRSFGKCREDHREFCANARVAGNLVSVFFLLVLTVEVNPFTIFDPGSPGGAAFDVLLHSPGLLMMGYALFAVPLVWSFAWLKWDNARGSYPPLKHIHRDILGAWLLLTVFEVLSAVMGAWLMWRQAGFQGGWLRYVAPNISLVVWLPATALLCWSRLHKRDAVTAKWIVPLSLITFSSCILTTFLGRPDMPAGARRLFIILLIHLWALAAILVWRKCRRSGRSDETQEARCDS